MTRNLKRLLVAGAAGFIGSNFVRHVRRTRPNVEVTVLDKLTYAGNLANLVEFEGQAGYRFVHGDICDQDIVNSLAAQADAIVNFAAETHVDRSPSSRPTSEAPRCCARRHVSSATRCSF